MMSICFRSMLLPMSRTPLPLIVLFTLLGSAALNGERVRAASPPPPPPVHSDTWAKSTLENLSLEEKVGQLFMVRLGVELLGEKSPEYLQLRDSIRHYHIGALAMSIPANGRFAY